MPRRTPPQPAYKEVFDPQKPVVDVGGARVQVVTPGELTPVEIQLLKDARVDPHTLAQAKKLCRQIRAQKRKR